MSPLGAPLEQKGSRREAVAMGGCFYVWSIISLHDASLAFFARGMLQLLAEAVSKWSGPSPAIGILTSALGCLWANKAHPSCPDCSPELNCRPCPEPKQELSCHCYFPPGGSPTSTPRPGEVDPVGFEPGWPRGPFVGGFCAGVAFCATLLALWRWHLGQVSRGEASLKAQLDQLDLATAAKAAAAARQKRIGAGGSGVNSVRSGASSVTGRTTPGSFGQSDELVTEWRPRRGF